MAVIVDDAAGLLHLPPVHRHTTRPQLPLDADVLFARGSEALRDGVLRVQAGMLEAREEGLSTGAHAFDLGRIEGQVQLAAAGLGDAADQEDVVVAGHDEDDFVVLRRVGGDGERGFHFREVGPVVEDPDQGATERVAGLVAGERERGEAGAVDQDVGGEAVEEVLFLGEEVAGNGVGVESGAFGLDEQHEPLHGAVRVDDGCKVFVSVNGPVPRINAVLVYRVA